MKIEDLTINHKNHHLFDINFDENGMTKLFRLVLDVPQTHDLYGKKYGFNDIIAINCEINDYFDNQLGKRLDWGGRYATWLEENGFDSNSDNGWWSKEAVNPFMIKAFVKEMKEGE